MSFEITIGWLLRLASVLAGIYLLYYLGQLRKKLGGIIGKGLFWTGVAIVLLMMGVSYLGVLYANGTTADLQNEAIGPAFALAGFVFSLIGFRKMEELTKDR